MIELAIIGYLLGIIGCWIISDGAYSIALYLNAPSFRENEKQSWSKDHAIRLLRILCGAVLIILGGMLIWFGVRL